MSLFYVSRLRFCHSGNNKELLTYLLVSRGNELNNDDDDEEDDDDNDDDYDDNDDDDCDSESDSEGDGEGYYLLTMVISITFQPSSSRENPPMTLHTKD